MTARTFASAVLAAGALALSLCACSPDAGAGGAADDQPGRAAVEAPSFDGPWAGLFVSTWEESTDVERDALADGEIDELEYAYFRAQIIECMNGLGLDARWEPDGSLSYGNSETLDHDDVTECMRSSGLRIVTLKDTMVRNPENLDENQIMVACLQRAGVVPPSYTAEDFGSQRDIDAILDTEGFDGCNAAPLEYAR